MTFNENSPAVLDKIRELYHQCVSGSISTALLAAIKWGWELGVKDEKLDAQPRLGDN